MGVVQKLYPNDKHKDKERRELGRKRSVEERARAEVERIKAADAEKERRFQERREELAAQARARREAREQAEARQKREAREGREGRVRQEAERRERADKENARRAWMADGGTAEAFEEAWPKLRDEARSRRVMDADRRAREAHRQSTHSAF